MLKRIVFLIENKHYACHMLFLLCVICIASTSPIHAQEVCDNGIDDDGDGLIDLQDFVDCSCAQILTASLLGDFESYSCCPSGPTGLPGDGFDCIDDGWILPNLQSSDYFNTCNYLGGPPLPFVPLPIPSGDGCVGFASVSGGNEQIASCLPGALVPGATYNFGFYIGFNEDPGSVVVSTLDPVVYLMGSNDCSSIPGTSGGCMSQQSGWYDMHSIQVQGVALNTWLKVETSFVATDATTVIAIAIDCGMSPLILYHFMDSVYITGDFFIEPDDEIFISSSGDCVSGITLEVPPVAGATYQWYENGVAIAGATSNPFLPDPPFDGIYQVVVDDGTQCVISDTFLLSVDYNVLEIDPTLTRVICFNDENGAIDLFPQSTNLPIDFMWDNGEMSEDIDNIAAGTYMVTVIDNNGCFAIETYVLDNPDTLASTIVVVQPVDGQPGTANITTGGGIPDYTYDWSNGTMSNFDNNLLPGMYSVTVTDSLGCEHIIDFEIYDELIAEETVSDETCFSACDGVAAVAISGGLLNYNIVWSNGQSSNVISGLCPGIYSYVITDMFGTVLTDTILIRPGPELMITGAYEEVVCDGSDGTSIAVTVIGGAGPYQYLWDSGEQTDSISNVQEGLHIVTVTDVNNCSAIDSFDISFSPSIILTGTTVNDNCDAIPIGSIDLMISGGVSPFQIEWSNSETTEDISSLAAGRYFVTVTDTNNCQDTTSFLIEQPASIEVAETITNNDCASTDQGRIELTIFGGTPTYNIVWETGDTSAIIDGLANGIYAVTISDQGGCGLIDSFEVIGGSAITVEDSLVDISCFGESDGQIILDITGGVLPRTIEWNTGDTTSSLNNLTDGFYSVTVTDADGCFDTSSYVLISPNELIIQSIIENTSCGGASTGNIYLNISGGSPDYNILWAEGQTNDSLINLARGTYYVTVTDDDGCSLADSFDVLEGENLIIDDSIQQVSCFGLADGWIDLDISGGTQPYSILWSTTEATARIENLIAGTYDVTVTDDAGCVNTTSYTVTQPDSIELNAIVTDPQCFGELGQIELTPVGGTGDYNYAWSQSGVTNMIMAPADMSYTVTVTDDNLCEKIESFSLNQPTDITVESELEDPLCFNDLGQINLTVSGGTPGYSFLWNTMDTTNSISAAAAMNYAVTVTDMNNCEYIDGFILSQPDTIAIEIESIVLPTTGDNGSVLISISGGTAPYVILWDDPLSQNTLLADSLDFGTYTVVVTDANNCMSQMTVVLDGAQLTVEVLASSDVCFGECTGSLGVNVIGGTPPFSITWSDGQESAEAIELCAGTYDVTVLDGIGQTFVSDILVVDSAPELMLTEQIVDNFDAQTPTGSIELIVDGGTPPYQNTWSDGSSTSSISNLVSGEYAVSILDLNNCELIESFTIVDIFDEVNVYIPNVFSPNNDGINDEFRIYSNSEDLVVVDFSIYNRWGGRVFQRSQVRLNEMTNWDGTVGDRQAENGAYVYVVQLTNSNDDVTTRYGEVMILR